MALVEWGPQLVVDMKYSGLWYRRSGITYWVTYWVISCFDKKKITIFGGEKGNCPFSKEMKKYSKSIK